MLVSGVCTSGTNIRSGRAVKLFGLVAACGLASQVCAQVVISEVYGGGGNAGATYRNDYVELKNRGTTSASIGNWSIQYSSSTGTTWQVVTIPAGTTLAAGQHFLIALASGGTSGSLLPSANVTGSINMSATAGKVALCNTITALSGSCPTSIAIVDKVGYGAANCSEGTPAGTASNTTAVVRDLGGCEDTGSNSANFTVGAPNPQNSSVITACGGGPGGTPLKICTWNTTQYSVASPTRDPAFKTALYGVFSGRSLAPDVLCAQEYSSQTSINDFLTVLNTASGSPGDWAAATFVDGPDLDNVFFYRTTRVTHLGTRIIAVGSTASTNQPRHTLRHDLIPVGYSGASNSIGIYNSHMKSGSTTADQSRRTVEAVRIRDNAEGVNTNGTGSGLPAGYNFIVLGDFNIQTSTQLAYQELVGSQVNNNGRFFDPINTAGSWNNNSAYRFVHTQNPAGDMDDRLDFILVSASLRNGGGIDYIGNSTLAYSTTTWNDPNHSYLVWGNDGESYGGAIRTTGNTMVGSTIASALITTCGTGATGGHLPVSLNLSLPGVGLLMLGKDSHDPDTGNTQMPAVRRFARGSDATIHVMVENVGDTAEWSVDGISDLLYVVHAEGAASVPQEVAHEIYRESAAAGRNEHVINLATHRLGRHRAKIAMTTLAGESTSDAIEVAFEVFEAGDLNGDGQLTQSDLELFSDAIAKGDLTGDRTLDGTVDWEDFAEVAFDVSQRPQVEPVAVK